MKAVFLVVFLFVGMAQAEICKELVSEILEQNGFGTFDRPEQLAKSQNDLAITFGNPVGLTKKDAFRMKVLKSNGALILEARNAFGNLEKRQIQLNKNCKIQSIIQEDDSGNRAEVNSTFCNNYENRKSKLTDSDYANPSKEFLSGAKFECYKPVAGFGLCNAYKGNFSGQTKRMTPDSSGKCFSPRVLSADGKFCDPGPCPPGMVFFDDIGACVKQGTQSTTSQPTKQAR